MSTSNPKVLSTETLLKGFLTIRKENLLYPSGHRQAYYIMDTNHPEAVAVLAITPEGKFILNEEYRHPTKQFVLSPPGGYQDPNETPEKAAERELLEETGYKAKSYYHLGCVYPFPGISSQKVHFVLATDAVLLQETHLEPGEILRTLLMEKQVLYQKIRTGEAVDGMLCAALFHFQLESI